MDYNVHPTALVQAKKIGKGTNIWAFCNVLERAQIGEDCNICDHVFIENDVVVGNRVTVKCGVQFWDGLRLEDDVFVGPNATFANDKFPRSKAHLDKPLITVVERGASIGANATILPGLVIGQHAMVGAGSVVTKNVPPYAIVVGNPARVSGYVNSTKIGTNEAAGDKQSATQDVTATGVGGVKIYCIPEHTDIRGSINVGEYEKQVPFQIKRFFLVYHVPSKEVRGEHAHKKQHQYLVCVNGSVNVIVDDGTNRREIQLDSSNVGLHIPPLVWGVQYKYSPDAVLLVFASDAYESSDYIRDYGEFLKQIKK